MKVGDSNLIRNIDNYCIEELKIPSMVLMENAALKVLKNIDFKKFKSFTIVCGSGNNGGDGLALARHIFANGYKVNVFIVGNGKMSNDFKNNYNILKNMNLEIKSIKDSKDIVSLNEDLNENDVVIDAIFGIGLKREIEGIYKDVVNNINEKSKYIISIDIPSGMKCDTFGTFENCIKANKTISFEVYKRGFLDYKSEEYTGEVVVEKIGIPEFVVDKFHNKEYLVNEEYIKGILKKREKYSHKGDFGRVSIIAGSDNYIGAAYIASQSAVRSGAGLVTLFTKESIIDNLRNKIVEAMIMSYEDKEFKDKISKSDSIAIGPGMGNNKSTFEYVKEIILTEGCPVVIDADGLNVLQNNLDILSMAKRKIIMTPHMGEMSRLTGIPINELVEDRINIAPNFAKKYNVILLLKGYNTIITDGYSIYINTTGNSKMASGGMGDTLTGIIASFIGQKYELLQATILATYIHGKCGDELSKNMFCVNASHIIESIPYTLSKIEII